MISFDGFVNYEGRRFGVPYRYQGKTVRIRRNGFYIEGSFNIVFTSNKNPAQWRSNFNEDDALLCALDRIFDDATVITMGIYDFQALLGTVLTDRGSEFADPASLETNADGFVRSSIYFCDPMRSGQKGGIEQAHTMLRMVLPKGTGFEFLTQWDLRTIVDHTDSTR